MIDFCQLGAVRCTATECSQIDAVTFAQGWEEAACRTAGQSLAITADSVIRHGGIGIDVATMQKGGS